MLCRAIEFRPLLPMAAALLGSANLWSGRVAVAEPLLDEAGEAVTAMRTPFARRSLLITLLGAARLVLGRVAEAREQAEQAVALARARPQRGWEALSLKLLGDVLAHELAEAEQAGDAHRRALALATELGMRPLVAHCHFGLAKPQAEAG